MNDPRGPVRAIVSVDDTRNDCTLVALDCGHTARANQIFTYRIGSDYRCMSCISASSDLWNGDEARDRGPADEPAFGVDRDPGMHW